MAYAATRKKKLTVVFDLKDKDALKWKPVLAKPKPGQWDKIAWYVYRHKTKTPRAYDRPFALDKIPTGWWFAGKVTGVSRKTALARAKHGLLPV